MDNLRFDRQIKNLYKRRACERKIKILKLHGFKSSDANVNKPIFILRCYLPSVSINKSSPKSEVNNATSTEPQNS